MKKLIALLSLALSACQEPVPATNVISIATPQPIAVATPLPKLSIVPSPTPKVIASPSPTAKPISTPSPTPTATPKTVPSPSPSVKPTLPATSKPTIIATPIPTVFVWANALMAPIQGINGYSVYSLGRSVYVANEGLDTNACTLAAPCKTYTAAIKLLNANKADSLLFKAGEIFPITGVIVPGRSGTASQPIVISSYGVGARPLLTGGGIYFLTPTMQHAVISGLHIACKTGTGAGINLLSSGSDVLIEDNEIEQCFDNIGADTAGGRGAGKGFQNLRIRRNYIHDATGPVVGSIVQGLYVSATDGILIEGNFFDHNGWVGIPATIGTIFNHHIYLQHDNSSNILIQDNIFTRGLDSVQVRPGGRVYGNLFWQAPIAITMKQSIGVISGNIILHGGDISPTLPRGFGIYLDIVTPQNAGNILSIANNIFAFDDSAKATGAVVQANNNPATITITGNLAYQWRNGFNIKGSPKAIMGTGNNLVGPFKSPSNGIEQYMGSLGLPATSAQFMTSFGSQSKEHFDNRFTASSAIAYLKAQF